MFLWLVARVAVWCGTSGVHALAASLDSKVLWAQVQVVGIQSVPPLWLLFAGKYAGTCWIRRPRVRVAVWIVPVVTMVVAATNEWHRAFWPDVVLDSSGLVVYGHGWWFWIAAGYGYALVLTGAALLLAA